MTTLNPEHNATQLTMQETTHSEPTLAIPVHNAQEMAEPELWLLSPFASPAHNAQVLDDLTSYFRNGSSSVCWNAGLDDELDEMLVYYADHGWLSQDAHNEQAEYDETMAIYDRMNELRSDVLDHMHNAQVSSATLDECEDWDDDDDDDFNPTHNAAGLTDERTTTMTDMETMRLRDEIAHELRTHLDDEPQRFAPMVNDWTSFADDPWTSARDLAHKNAQEMALEARPWNTEAGTGWYGEISPTGFGQYAPNAGMTGVNAQDSAGELADLLPTDDFSDAHTVGVLLDANGEMLPMTDEMLAEARLAAGMRANGAWHDAPLENDRWLTEGGLYTGPPSSMTEAEAIDEFGSYETAGEVSRRFDRFSQVAEALENAPATYRAQF